LDANEPHNALPAAVAPLPLPPLAPAPPGAWYGAVPLYPPPLYYPDYYFGYFAPPPPRVWPVFVVYLLAFVAMQLVGMVVLLGAVFLEHAHDFQSPEQFIGLIQQTLSDPDILLLFLLAMQIALVATAVGAAWLSPVPLVRRLRLGPSTLPWYGYPLVVLGAVSVGLMFQVLAHLLHVPEPKELKSFSDALTHLTPWQVVAAVLVVGGAPAFGEEWLFRGYMQSRLSQRWGRWAAISITAVLFGVMHLNVLQGTFATMLGFYIGYLAEKSGSVRPGMFCHFANNGFQVILARYGAQINISPTAESVILGCVAVLIVAAILYMVIGVHPPVEPVEPPTPPPLPTYLPPYFPPPPALALPTASI
jgi:membrane protease YdiL (CAAX protease family)